jgi:hypothetical protein
MHIVLLPHETETFQYHRPKTVDEAAALSAEVATKDGRILAGVDVPSSDLPLHRLPEHREGGAERRRGESGRRRLILRE